ncbi:MAG: formate dehydrogenase accessory sulfurtransferase FdhD [Methanomicrobiales archaeon]|nr:formate dehydrogenase accessory sulfurtransferase FdhD [Methanomicrobiales archaeon]
MSMEKVEAIQFRGGRFSRIGDLVVKERVFRLFINGQFFCRIVASGEYLEELGAGFVICEGLTERIVEIEVKDEEIHVEAAIRTGGVCGIGSAGGLELEREIPMVRGDAFVTPAEILRITREIESELWQQTGGVHCAVLFRDGEPLVRRCDVGRHNTVDKVVGYAILRGIDLSRCAIGCTGRQPAGMVAKAARAGIPIVISKAATTDRGIETAEKAGITLICFSRGDRFTCYSHPERVIGSPDPATLKAGQ